MLENKGFSEQDPTFWLSQRVLITGQTGFVGSWLAARLSELGADVTGFARRPAAPLGVFGLAELDQRVTSLTGDIRDRARVEQTVAAMAPEIVYHLAGRRAAAVDLKRPLDSFDTNATGTLNLLHAARANPRLRAVVIVTTDEPSRLAYPVPTAAGHSPAATGRGDAEPMAASLACAAIIADTFRQCYLQPADGIGLASLHLPELVGGGDSAQDRLVPSLLRAMTAGRVPALERPTDHHPLMHVLDAVEGCLALARALVRRPGTFAGSWSLRPAAPQPWTRAAIADHVAARVGGSWMPFQAPDASGPLGTRRHSRGLPIGSAVRASDAATVAIAPTGVEPAATPPVSADPALAAALGWQPRLDVATALDWALEGQRRLEGEADGRFLDEQCQRYAALVQTMGRGGRPARLRRMPAAEPGHAPASA